MNYREELRNLERDQEKLDTIRERNARKRRKLVLDAIGAIPVVGLYFAVSAILPSDIPSIVRLAVSGFSAVFVALLTLIPTMIYGDPILDWYESWREDLSEEAILKKSEADRKAKIAFFERLINDPDFRAAWEAQMKEKA